MGHVISERRILTVELKNKLGKEIVKPIYDEITISSLQHFIVKKDNKYGLLDKDAKIIIPVDKENIKTLGKENIFVIKNFDQTMGLYFANEKNLTPFIYQSVKYRWCSTL